MAISFQESGDGPSATVDFFAACKMFAASIGARKSPRDFLDSNLFIHRAGGAAGTPQYSKGTQLTRRTICRVMPALRAARAKNDRQVERRNNSRYLYARRGSSDSWAGDFSFRETHQRAGVN